MLGFRKSPMRHNGGNEGGSGYRYRVETREKLIQRYELIALSPTGEKVNHQERLACVLEEAAQDGWRLVGISDEDFIFRRRG